MGQGFAIVKHFFRFAGILAIIISIVWLIVKPGFDSLEALLVALFGLGSLIGSFASDKLRDGTETLDQRNRRIMLNHVEEFWVKGILEKSLYGAVLLDLGMKEDPQALEYPWTIKREANQEMLPMGKPMLEVFQEIGLRRSLLILGRPGSGKTTMLLELARQLIECARMDEREPIPVVFNLASWTERQTLAEWLSIELNVFYNLPKQMSKGWVSDNKMLLLLDGLDEVKQDCRVKCLDAINAFRKEHGLSSIVVCSRSQEYSELNERLALNGAIEIQPLTSNQVEKYLDRFGNQLAGARLALQKDTALREMAESPLFLSIMALAYRNKRSADILASGNIAEQYTQLFNTYIARMFERPERANNERFKKQDALHWLSWLAHKMTEHNQILFILERMQPNWINQKKVLLSYQLLVELIFGLNFGLVFGLVFWEISVLRFALIFGLCFGLLLALIFWRTDRQGQINTVDALTWDWQKAKKGLLVGLGLGLTVGLIVGLFTGLNFGLQSGLIIGLSIGLMGGLNSGVMGGLSVQQVDQTTRPGQRLSFTTRNFFFTSLLFGLLFGLFYGLFPGPIGGLGPRLIMGLGAGLFIGILFYGGFAIIQHYCLRLILSINKLLPWKLVSFLDYSTDLIFLRRIGGGYIFVHRLLMEHFAEMYHGEK